MMHYGKEEAIPYFRSYDFIYFLDMCAFHQAEGRSEAIPFPVHSLVTPISVGLLVGTFQLHVFP